MIDFLLNGTFFLTLVASLLVGSLGLAAFIYRRRKSLSQIKSLPRIAGKSNKKPKNSSHFKNGKEIHKFVTDHIAKTGEEPGPEVLAHLTSLAKRKRQADALADLSKREQDEEMRMRQKQLAEMAELMSQRPDQFGPTTLADVNSQLCSLYAY